MRILSFSLLFLFCISCTGTPDPLPSNSSSSSSDPLKQSSSSGSSNSSSSSSSNSSSSSSSNSSSSSSLMTETVDLAKYQSALAQANQAFEAKHQSGKLKEAFQGYQSAHQLKAGDRKVYERLMRCIFYLTEYEMGGENDQKAEKIELLAQGKEYGFQAIQLNSRMKQALTERQDWGVIASYGASEDVGILYWLAVCWGRWGELKGITSAAADIGKVQALMDKANALNDTYFAGGPDRFYGVFYMKIPKVSGQDSAKARTHFQRAIQLAPDYLPNYLLFARYYCVGEDDEELFVELCNEIIAKEKEASLIDPDWKLDNMEAIKRAKMWLKDDYYMNELF
jgi:tetratricopeptide (TPR) repeat protein